MFKNVNACVFLESGLETALHPNEYKQPTGLRSQTIHSEQQQVRFDRFDWYLCGSFFDLQQRFGYKFRLRLSWPFELDFIVYRRESNDNVLFNAGINTRAIQITNSIGRIVQTMARETTSMPHSITECYQFDGLFYGLICIIILIINCIR